MARSLTMADTDLKLARKIASAKEEYIDKGQTQQSALTDFPITGSWIIV
jgi:hypothetical protein